MDIQIEPGAPADLDAMELFYDEVNDALAQGVNHPGWQKGLYPTRKDAAAALDSHTLFVARSGHRIVGSVILNHQPEQGYAGARWNYDGADSSVLVIHTLAVHPCCVKAGVGAQLMNFAERFGQQNNIKAIRLDVYEKNAPAIRLYERCGYRYIDTVDLGFACYGLDRFRLYEKCL